MIEDTPNPRAQKCLERVARRALEGIDSLPPLEQRALLEGASYILPEPEASVARSAAQSLLEAKKHQLKLTSLFKDAV